MGAPAFSDQSIKFLQLKTRSDLAHWLGVNDRQLRYVLYTLPESSKYRTFSIKKRNGGDRNIDAPIRFLKFSQARINQAIQEVSPPSGIAKGYVPGKSIYDHARLHRSKRWVLLADIENFFPSINFGRVRGAFMARPFLFPEPIATCLAQLCCKGGALPQGGPSSPAISNLICRSLDHSLISLGRRLRCNVSRYADDICISTNLKVVPRELAVLDALGNYAPGSQLVDVLDSSGFSLNKGKFHVRSQRDRQMVTGLVVNRGVSMPRKWKRQLRVLLHTLGKNGDEEGLKIVADWARPATRNRPVKSLKSLVSGKANFAAWLDSRSGTSFIDSLHRSYPKVRNVLSRIKPSTSLRLMTEGDSDALHLEAAIRHFHANGEYLDIDPVFRNYQGDKGDEDLWETLLRIAKFDVDELTIAIFDCDNPGFMKKKAMAVGGFHPLGRRVFAMCLGRPDFEVGDLFCIESLYPRSESTQSTSDERRLYFADEFDGKGLHVSGNYIREFPKKKALVLSDKVLRISDGRSSLLSKMEFANMVSVGATPFGAMSFDGFRPTMKVIRSILDRSPWLFCLSFDRS